MYPPAIIEDHEHLKTLPGIGSIYRVVFAAAETEEVQETDEGEVEDAECKTAMERLLAVRANGQERWSDTMGLAEKFLGSQMELFQ